jgi:hypothetical protein
MAKRCIAFLAVLSVAVALHGAAAARTVPTATASLPADAAGSRSGPLAAGSRSVVAVPVASAAAEALVASRRELLQGTVATSPGHASTREQGRGAFCFACV